MHARFRSVPAPQMLGLSVILCAAPQARGFDGGPTPCGQPGPDLIVAVIDSPANYSSEQIGVEFFDAFSFGRNICNMGNQNLLVVWFPSTQHPALTQGLFKIKESPTATIEQIGMSWVCHHFTALTQSLCCMCNGQGGSVLGAGCNDPKPGGVVGNQAQLTPRWQVNGYTGVFPSKSADPPYTGTTARRLRVKSADLELSSPDVQYVIEFNGVSAHDSSFGHQFNNTSYREATITGSPPNFTAAAVGTTHREQPAIHAWKAADPAVVETIVQIPNEGLLILAAKATDLGDGFWRYEYALQNVNSDISARSFSVPLPDGAKITNVGFHDVDYHSGDGIPLPDGPDADTDPDWRNFDGTDWSVTQTAHSITWSTQKFTENDNANALRWATLYNFRFDAARPPASQAGDVVIGTYKVQGSIDAPTIGPSPACIADIAPTGGDSASGDGQVNIDDLFAIITAWGTCPAFPLGCPQDIDNDGDADIDDLFAVIAAWGPCP